MEFIDGFAPNLAVREEILRRLATTSNADTNEATSRREALEERQRRARDLYELGDLTRPEYMARRDAINTELATLAPGPIPDIGQARKVLEDFTIFWRTETDPDAKRQFLHHIFAGVWLDQDRVVAVQPKPSFLPFFEDQHRSHSQTREKAGVKYGSDGGRVRTLPPGEIEVWRTAPTAGRP